METRDTSRPLSARSIVASTLLGVRPPRLPARSLVASGGLFGVAEGTIRTALSRMVAAGELTVEDGTYELAGPLRARQERQEESRAGAVGPWAGAWELALVEGEGRPAGERAALRSAMRALRLAELREGVWLRPDNLAPDRLPEARAVVDAQCVRLTAVPDDDGPSLAARLWDLGGWSRAADRLTDELAAVVPALDGEPEVLAPAFVLAASALRHTQADPLLPEALLPAGWPGDRLRSTYERFDAAFNRVWRARLRRLA